MLKWMLTRTGERGTDWFGTEHGPAGAFVNTVMSLREGNVMTDWLVGWLASYLVG